MNPDTLLEIALGLVVGAALGLVFFGGLWLTLRRLPETAHAGLWVLLSYFGRVGLAVLGFGLLLRRGLLTLAVGLAAFFAVRAVLTRRIGVRPRGKGP